MHGSVEFENGQLGGQIIKGFDQRAMPSQFGRANPQRQKGYRIRSEEKQRLHLEPQAGPALRAGPPSKTIKLKGDGCGKKRLPPLRLLLAKPSLGNKARGN